MLLDKFTIAIHPDDYTPPGKPPESDAASPRWASLLQEAGHKVRWVDVRRPDILDQVKGCNAFMWRWAHFAGMSRIARRLLPILERELNLIVYPDQNTCWHYDDKVAQSYLFEALGIPSPRTWVWFDMQAACDWAATASYPLVLKLATGAGSNNVRLVKDFFEARRWIEGLFSRVVQDLNPAESERLALISRLHHAGKVIIKGEPRQMRDNGCEPQTGYVLFQEFLPDNAFDTRVTVIGNRAFAFRRFNRDDDFRASGSGKIDWNPKVVDQGFLRVAFKTSQVLRMQSCAIDGLYRGDAQVIAEISYTYVSEAVYNCPGYWVLDGDPQTGTLNWIDGHMWPEKAQIQDFLHRLRQVPTRRASQCE
jgi:glutathione synthase/RimK-type ligase-like ATP-grasp enzyme